MKEYNHGYVFVMYDIANESSEAGKNRVSKVFKICKKYLKHYQKSVFRGSITPSKTMEMVDELKQVIDEKIDFIAIIKMKNKNSFQEEKIGTPQKDSESIFL